MAHNGDGVEFPVAGEFSECDVGSHAAGEPSLDNWSGASFLGEDLCSFLGPEDWAGEDEVGDEIVFAKEASDAVGLLDSFGNEGPGKITAGEPVGIGGGVSEKIERHATSSCLRRQRGPDR